MSLIEYNWRTWSAVPVVTMVSMVVTVVHLGALELIIIEVTFRGVVELLVSFWRNKKN